MGAAADHAQGVRVGEVLGGDEGGEFAEGVAEGDGYAGWGDEAEFLFEDAQDHDGGSHDGRLGVFRRGEGGVGAVGDDGAERGGEDVVHFFEKEFAGFGKRFKPGSGHADALNALA